jgi:fructose-bisphosphate aldolase class II/tagatose 1,6-diphosphate aldolase GatY/KbaY
MTLQEKLQELNQNNQALLATNFYNYETLRAVINGVKESGQSIILQASESTIKYLGVRPAVDMARAVLAEQGVTGWLHLDHAEDVDLLKSCLQAGFDSVMIDASKHPFEENVRISREVVEYARSFRANVEAELGYIAKLGQSQESLEYTKAREAKEFVEQTGVDCLAVAVGSSHGFYKQAPELQIERIAEIHQATSAHLVLHGSSGIPGEQIRSAIQNGMRKINIATEIKDTFMSSLKSVLLDSEEIDLRKVFPQAMEPVKKLIVNKLNVIRHA